MPPSYQRVTFLEDLPELETLEPSMDEQTDRNESIKRRFLKNHHSPLSQSGMSSDQEMMSMQMQGPPMGFPIRSEQLQIQRGSEIIEPVVSRPSFSCQDIYYHIEDCPMCKKFYKSDITMYLIVIAILIVVCALLLKKVLNV